MKPSLKRFLVSIFLLLPCFVMAQSVGSKPPEGAPKSAPDTDPVVLTVGDRTVKASEFDQLIESLPPQMRAFYALGQNRRSLVDYIVNLEILKQEALTKHLEDRKDVKRQLDLARDSVLAAAMQEEIARGLAISEEELKQEYESRKSSYEEVRVRHILLPSRESLNPETGERNAKLPPSDAVKKQAEELRKQALAGKDFAEMAKEHSKDAGSASNGGELGFIKRGATLPPFEEAAFRLKPGEISEPVESAYGWHVIQVEEKRSKTLEEAKDELTGFVRARKGQEALQSLRAKYKSTINEKYFESLAKPESQDSPLEPSKASGSSEAPKPEKKPNE